MDKKIGEALRAQDFVSKMRDRGLELFVLYHHGGRKYWQLTNGTDVSQEMVDTCLSLGLLKPKRLGFIDEYKPA